MTFKKHDSEQRVITPNTRVPLYVVGSAIGLAVYITCLFWSMSSKLDGAVSANQFQHWIDDAREKNPTLFWPRLPEKQSKHDPVTFTEIQ